MKVIRKINNNIAIAVDGENNEVIVFGKGIGFGELPYEIKDLSRIERTFYDIHSKYYGLLKEVPDQIFTLTVKMLDAAKKNIDGELNSNLVFILADHINFAITRERKGMNVTLPYSYELEYSYPELTKIAKWMVKTINERMGVQLNTGEVTSITMHFINALEGTKASGNGQMLEQKINKVILAATKIVEDHFSIQVDKNDFNYFRFKNHLNILSSEQRTGICLSIAIMSYMKV